MYYEAPNEVGNLCTHKQEYSYNQKMVNECFLLSGQASCLNNENCWFNGRAPAAPDGSSDASSSTAFSEFLIKEGETKEEIQINEDGYMVQVKKEFVVPSTDKTPLLIAVGVAILLLFIIICILCYFMGSRNRVHNGPGVG